MSLNLGDSENHRLQRVLFLNRLSVINNTQSHPDKWVNVVGIKVDTAITANGIETFNMGRTEIAPPSCASRRAWPELGRLAVIDRRKMPTDTVFIPSAIVPTFIVAAIIPITLL